MTADSSARTARGFVVALVAIALAHLALYVWRFDEAALFNVDVERDLTRAWDWLTGGAYPFAGPNISDTQVTLGSMFYLLLAIPMSIGPDPLLVRGFFVVCASLSLIVFGLTLRRFVKPSVALTAVVALGLSNFWFENLRQLWHSNLLPLVVATFFAGYAAFIDGFRRRWWFLAVGAAALSIQLHATMIVLPLALLLAAWVYRKELRLGGILASAVIAAVVLTPFILGLVMADMEQTRELDRWLGYSTGGSVVDALGYLVWSTIPGLGTPSARGWFGGPAALAGLLMLILIVAGGRYAASREAGARLGLPRLLLFIVVGGLAIQLIVFKHESSTRYLHANAYALMFLAAFGANSLLAKVPVRAATPVLALATLALLAVGTLRSAVPSEGGAAYCSLVAQRAAATAIVDGYGVPAVDVERRVHGLACRHRSSGYRWFYRSRPQSKSKAAAVREKDLHVFMMPADLPLRPASRTVYDEQVIGDEHRALRITAYQPIIDYHRLHRAVVRERATTSSLPEAGRRAPGAGDGAIRETLTFPYSDGAETLHLRFWQGGGDDCALLVTNQNGPIVPTRIEAASTRGQRLFEIPVGTQAGQMQIQLGPCADLDSVEVF